jgi:uncharacterized protein YndB with AHSA1/START domain
VTAPRTLSVVRDLPHPPERVWRALTQPHLLAEWLIPPDDFRAQAGHAFTLAADWGTVDARVLEVEPPRSLTWSWRVLSLDSVVRFTLAAIPGGTRLTLEQTGFADTSVREYYGARAGWPRFLDRLAHVLSRP